MNLRLMRIHFAAVAAFVAIVAISRVDAQTFTPGIDVSRFQGDINWTAVKNAGVQFAFCKATEGVDFVDAKFVQNMNAASAAEVYIGPYHFARIDSFENDPLDAQKEALDFVEAIAPFYQMPGKFLRPVLDVQTVPNDGRSINPYTSQWVRDFIATVESQLGLEPIIYADPLFAIAYLEPDLGQHPFWLQYYDIAPPSLPDPVFTGVFQTLDFWQYSNTGSVPGVVGAVDLDVYLGTLEQLRSKFVVVPEPATVPLIAIALVAIASTCRHAVRTGRAVGE